MKAEQVKITAKLAAAQLATRNALDMPQLAALEAKNVLATAIAQASILKDRLTQSVNVAKYSLNSIL
ncbi:MAG: hypothetical protein WCG46_05405 [Methylophilaceae bacterium]